MNIILLLLGLAVLGCTSPEATRARGDGPGADVGNRSRVVEMHEGSAPYHGTPRLLADRLRAPIDSAGQADRLSRRSTQVSER